MELHICDQKVFSNRNIAPRMQDLLDNLICTSKLLDYKVNYVVSKVNKDNFSYKMKIQIYYGTEGNPIIIKQKGLCEIVFYVIKNRLNAVGCVVFESNKVKHVSNCKDDWLNCLEMAFNYIKQ
jgi:hypothetical protein